MCRAWWCCRQQQDVILSYNEACLKFYTPWAHLSYVTPSIYSISITCVFTKGSAAAAVADLPYRARASSLSGRIRKNPCKPRHLCAIYNTLVRVSLTTWAAFIGDNERKRWDASLLLPSPPQRSFHLSFPQGWFTTCDPCGCLVGNRQQSVWDENRWAVVG